LFQDAVLVRMVHHDALIGDDEQVAVGAGAQGVQLGRERGPQQVDGAQQDADQLAVGIAQRLRQHHHRLSRDGAFEGR
jgi:thiamine monophosphate synthase